MTDRLSIFVGRVTVIVIVFGCWILCGLSFFFGISFVELSVRSTRGVISARKGRKEGEIEAKNEKTINFRSYQGATLINKALPPWPAWLKELKELKVFHGATLSSVVKIMQLANRFSFAQLAIETQASRSPSPSGPYYQSHTRMFTHKSEAMSKTEEDGLNCLETGPTRPGPRSG